MATPQQVYAYIGDSDDSLIEALERSNMATIGGVQVSLEQLVRSITTAAEGKIAYEQVPPDSIAGTIILELWQRRSLDEVTAAISSTEMKSAYHDAPPCSLARIRLLLSLLKMELP